MAESMRVCPVTRFHVYSKTERLIGINVVTAILFMVVGGISVLFVLFARTVPNIVAPNIYYPALSLHGWNMLIFWIIFFEIGILYFVCSVMMNAPLAYPRLAWLAYGLMLLGAIIVDVSHIDPANWLMFTAYVPLRGTWHFYLGAILFFVGALIAGAIFFVTLYIAKRPGTSLSLIVFGGFTAAVLALTTIIPGLITYIPRLLWSLNIIPYIDPIIDKIAFWAVGHPAQQINLAATIAVWYLLALLTTGGTTPSEKVSRAAFLLYLFAIQLGSAHHLETEPALPVAWKWFNTGYAMHLAVLASMIHAFAVPAAIELGLRGQGYTKGLFQWLFKAPWRNPAFSSLIFSIVLFGFLGGTTGVVYGMEQSNLNFHNTMAIPGHFHAVVVAGTTLAFMGLTWLAIPLILRREIVGKRLASIQPWIYSIGMFLLILGFIWSGALSGIPRRSADIFTTGIAWPSLTGVYLTIWLVGGLLAIIGGVIYVLLSVTSVLAGKKMTDEEIRQKYAIPTHVVHKANGGVIVAIPEHPQVRGTPIATIIFWVFFLALFVVSYMMLGMKWELGPRG